MRNIHFERQAALPVVYKGKRLDCGYRMDVVVDRQVVVEVKAVESLERIHEAQLLTYLRLSGMTRGLILNFNRPVLRDGIVRRVLNHPDSASAFSASPR
jgi:GxxExxY protein